MTRENLVTHMEKCPAKTAQCNPDSCMGPVYVYWATVARQEEAYEIGRAIYGKMAEGV